MDLGLAFLQELELELELELAIHWLYLYPRLCEVMDQALSTEYRGLVVVAACGDVHLQPRVRFDTPCFSMSPAKPIPAAILCA
jgi:hypothetical protein